MRTSTIALSCILFHASSGQFAAAQQRETKKCLGVSNVLEYLGRSKKSPPTYPQAVLILDVQMRGFCGQPTPGELEKIRLAGATPALMNLIAPPSTHILDPIKPPPPPPVKEGLLHVLCQPADCQVFVNGKLHGPTAGGELSETLPPGLISVTAKREDYDVEPALLNGEIKDKETTTIPFDLKVARIALETAGSKLFDRMFQALGGEEGIKALSFFKVKGPLICYDREGQQTAWDISANVKLPAEARFDVSRSGSKTAYQIANSEIGMEWNKKEKPSPQLEDLDLALRRFQDQQIARVVGHFRTGGFKFVASELTVKPGDEPVVTAEGGGQTYRIRIGTDMRPREILFESGLNKGLKIIYSDYVESAGTAYPLSLEIQYLDSEHHGVAAKFRSVVLNPADVKDADLHLKKKGTGLSKLGM